MIGVSRRVRTPESEFRSEAWLIRVLVWIAAEIGLVMILGMTGLLRLNVILGVALLAGLAGVVLIRSNDAKERGAAATPPRTWGFKPPIMALLLVLTSLGLVLLWQLATYPSLDPDTLNYRLPAIAEFYQHGQFARLPDYRFSSSYPFSWEALGTLMVLPFGEDFLATTPNVLAWALLGLACHLLARLLGASRSAAVLGATLVVCTPHLLTRLNSLQVDVVFAAFFVSACCAILLWRLRRDPLWLAMFLICGGLLAGFRLSGSVYWILTTPLFVLPLPGSHDRTEESMGSASRLRLALLGGLAAAILLGGFWYARNIVELGNPFGHMEVQVAGRTLFDGHHAAAPLRASTLAHALSSQGNATWGDLWTMLTEGLSWNLYALLGLTALTPLALITKDGRRRAGMTFGLLALVLATGMLYLNSPFSCNPGPGDRIISWSGQAIRYAYPGLALLGVTAAVGVGQLRLPKWLPVLAAAFVVYQGMQSVTQWQDMARPLVVMAIVGGLTWILLGRMRRAGYAPVVLALLLVLAVAGASRPARLHREDARHFVYGPGYAKLEELDPDAVCVVISNHMFMYYGRDMKRRVVDLHGIKKSGGEWLSDARESGVPFVAIGPVPRAAGPGIQKAMERMLARLQRHREPTLVRLYAGPLLSDIHLYKTITPSKH